MKLFYSPSVLNKPVYYVAMTWDELMEEEHDGLFHTSAQEVQEYFICLYRGMWFFIGPSTTSPIKEALYMDGRHRKRKFYRSKLDMPTIPYEVHDVNTYQWIRTPRPLSFSRKLIYALPKRLRRWIFRTKT